MRPLFQAGRRMRMTDKFGVSITDPPIRHARPQRQPDVDEGRYHRMLRRHRGRLRARCRLFPQGLSDESRRSSSFRYGRRRTTYGASVVRFHVQANDTPLSLIGSSAIRTSSCATALARAGAAGGVPGSPIPVGATADGTMYVSMLLMSEIRSGS